MKVTLVAKAGIVEVDATVFRDSMNFVNSGIHLFRSAAAGLCIVSFGSVEAGQLLSTPAQIRVLSRVPTTIDMSAFPPDRVINWNGQVGVTGGIPDRTLVRNCVTSDQVPVDGKTDSAAAIRRCLINTPANGVALLPRGMFIVKSTIDIPAQKTLKGEGRELTLLSAEAPLEKIVSIGKGTSTNPLLELQGGYSRGSTSLTLANATTISTGSYILVNELNDSRIPVSPESNAPGEGTCSWCDQFGATRLRAQVVKVVGKSGNVLSISPPFFFDFSAANLPRVMLLDQMAENSGLESLTVRNGPGATSGWRVNVMIAGAANSWVRDVRVDTCGKRCIDLRTYFFRIEVRDSYITQCLDRANSDTCYGTEVAEGSSSLIENNIYYETANGPLLMWGASGNVVGYNYIHNVYRTQQRDSWFWPTSWTHGAHPSYNLWEGNDFAALNWDGYWGSASHNTAFRNRIWGSSPQQGLQPGHVEVAAVLIEKNNHYMSVVGNVLGTEGWSDTYQLLDDLYWSPHAIFSIGIRGLGSTFSSLFRHLNFDYVTKSVKRCGESNEPSCQGGQPQVALPPSLYHAVKPSWFGNSTWPPISPEGPRVDPIPAKLSFGTSADLKQ